MKYFETHAHPDHPLIEDRAGYVRNMRAVGIDKMVIAPITYESNYQSMDLFPVNLYPDVLFSKGLHPKCAINNPMWGKYEKEKFCELLLDKRVVAVKSGIDLSKKKLQEKQIERQYDFLKMFMEMAKKYNKPLVLHIREASQEAIDFFKKNPLPVRAEIHCFTYDKDVMMQLIDVGIRFFGIGGMVTRSENFDLQEAVKEMPLDMILIESDAPFVKVEGDIGRVNTSSRAIPTVVRKIAEIKGLSEEEVAKKTYWNAMRFFWGEEFVEFMKTSLGFSEQNFFHTIESPGERPQLAEREVKYTEVSILNIDEWLL